MPEELLSVYPTLRRPFSRPHPPSSNALLARIPTEVGEGVAIMATLSPYMCELCRLAMARSRLYRPAGPISRRTFSSSPSSSIGIPLSSPSPAATLAAAASKQSSRYPQPIFYKPILDFNEIPPLVDPSTSPVFRPPPPPPPPPPRPPPSHPPLVGKKKLRELASLNWQAEAESRLYESVVRLDHMTKDRASEDCWDFVEASVWPLVLPLLQHLDHRSNYVTTVLQSVIDDVAKKKAVDAGNPKLPSAYRISCLMSVYTTDCAPRLDMVISMLDWLAGPGHKSDGSRSSVILEDVIRVLKQMSTYFEVTARPEDLVWRFPALHDSSESRKERDPVQSFHAALSNLFPFFILERERADHPKLAAALLGTTAAVNDPDRMTNHAVLAEAGPLRDRINYLLKSHAIDRSRLTGELFKSHRHLAGYITTRWHTITHTNVAPDVCEPAEFRRRLNVANHTNNVRDMDAVWADYKVKDAKRNPTSHSVEHLELLNYILWMACARKLDRLRSDVLAFMLKKGIKPTIRTYTAMLDGSKIGQSPDSIMAVWQAALLSGQPLDEYIWTAYIGGLVACNRVKAGLAALNQMQKTWEQAVATETQHQAVKPVIAVINATVAGLIRNGFLDVAKEVMVWAASKRIEADVLTYNTILRQLFNTGNDAGVEQILELMRSQGVLPDNATFGSIISHVLRRSANRDPAPKQILAIDAILASMAEYGVKPNSMNFADMLTAFDNHDDSGGGHDMVIEHVLQRMQDHNLAGTSYTRTILAKRELFQPSPNLALVRELVRNRDRRELVSSDTCFWQNVMLVLLRRDPSPAGPDPALELFYWLNAAARRVAMHVLKELLVALLARNRVQDAARLVRCVEERYADEPGTVRSEKQRNHGFWHLAAQYGLSARMGA